MKLWKVIDWENYTTAPKRQGATPPGLLISNCGREDLNLQALRHWILSPACLPIPPRPLYTNPLSLWERAGVRAFPATNSPHPNPLPLGEGTEFYHCITGTAWIGCPDDRCCTCTPKSGTNDIAPTPHCPSPDVILSVFHCKNNVSPSTSGSHVRR